jgi:hypothetical protein
MPEKWTVRTVINYNIKFKSSISIKYLPSIISKQLSHKLMKTFEYFYYASMCKNYFCVAIK